MVTICERKILEKLADRAIKKSTSFIDYRGDK